MPCRSRHPLGALTLGTITLVTTLVACGTVTTYQSADTLPRGTWQLSAALGAGGFNDKPQHSKLPTATFELAARRGMSDNLDLGLKLYTLGVEASVRYRIVRDRWSWALLGALGGARTDASSPVGDAGLTQLRLGAVASKRRSPSWAWNVGPTSTWSLWRPAGGGTAGGALLGGFAGFDWQFGGRWHLIPELSLHVTAAGDVPVDGSVVMLGAAIARDL